MGEGILCLHTFVAETDAECRKLAADAFNQYVVTRLYAKSAVYDDILRSGLGLFGSVETVAKKIIALDQMGVEHVMTLHDFGNMPSCKSASPSRRPRQTSRDQLGGRPRRQRQGFRNPAHHHGPAPQQVVG
jgi:hypothetical protein